MSLLFFAFRTVVPLRSTDNKGLLLVVLAKDFLTAFKYSLSHLISSHLISSYLILSSITFNSRSLRVFRLFSSDFSLH